MQHRIVRGVNIAISDSGTDRRPLILLHGCGLDHGSLSNQTAYFKESHRIISVDLRGHGASDAPHGDYSVASFAEDIAALCAGLGLVKPIVIGHSMGGNIALELAASYPELPSCVVMIDSLLFPTRDFIQALAPTFAALDTPDFLTSYRQLLSSVSLATDLRASEIIRTIEVKRHVLASALYQQVMVFDSVAAASKCKVAAAYIGAAVPLADLKQLQELLPQIQLGRTVGSGHFSPIEVPKQINAMIDRFLEVAEA